MSSKNCEIYQRLMAASLAGGLDDLNARRLDAHIEQCDACRRDFAELKETWAMIEIPPRKAAPAPPLKLRVNNVRTARRKSWLPASFAAAAVLALMFLGARELMNLRTPADGNHPQNQSIQATGISASAHADANAQQQTRVASNDFSSQTAKTNEPGTTAKTAPAPAASFGSNPPAASVRKHSQRARVEYASIKRHRVSPTRESAGWTPLHAAAWSGRIDAVEKLIEEGADVNARDEFGDTPLHAAVIQGREDVARLLISKGADPDAKDKSGWTPALTAELKQDADFKTMLVSATLNDGSEEHTAIQTSEPMPDRDRDMTERVAARKGLSCYAVSCNYSVKNVAFQLP